MPAVHIFTDGACMGNPGPGGWAAILRDPLSGKESRISGAEKRTTNNRMEMMAVIKALEILKMPCRVTLTTDSQYVSKGLSEWLDGWRRRGWRTAGGGAVKNLDLWQRLDGLREVHKLRCVWVPGHRGHPENEECDRLATAAIERLAAP
ncbi:MAG: ribonuclease HI [Acidobacteriota bacterium]